MQVPFYRHDLTAEDAAEIVKVITSPFLTAGPVCRRVEDQLCRYFGVPHAVMVNSWTAGATATLMAMGIGPGDEVIVPAMTFIATANVVEAVGAKPVFVDVCPRTLLIRAEDIRSALTPNTKAVIPVHLYGQMCDMKALRDTLPPQVKIIEDCAHCFEGQRNNERPGKYADAAIFSFYATKNVACGEGGAVICSDTALYERLLKTRLHGMSKSAVNRFDGGQYNHWDMECLGIKANMSDILAALLPRQIETIDARLPARQEKAAIYRNAFRGGPLRLIENDPACISADHLFTIHVPPAVRDEAIAALIGAGVHVTVNYRAVPTLTYYREKYGYTPDDFPVSHMWGEGTISLPLYQSLSTQEQNYVIKVVKDAIYPLCMEINSVDLTAARA